MSRSKLERLRRALYFAQRGIGDVQAAQRGPRHLARRLVRRVVQRTVLRRLGL